MQTTSLKDQDSFADRIASELAARKAKEEQAGISYLKLEKDVTMRIAIIGAGISGLTLARELSERAEVTVFEKARGVGGRMSTRYADPYYFDHGTQFFTARTKAFQKFLAPFIASGVVAEWQGKTIGLCVGKMPTKRMWFEPHYVAAPNMNSLCKALAEGLTLRLSTEIAPLGARAPDGWRLQTAQGEDCGVFDLVISTAPPAQTLRLFGSHLPQAPALHAATMQGCYTLMLGFARAWDKTWIAAKVKDNPLEWIAINTSKPARISASASATTCIVAHSTAAWAEAHMDDPMDEAQAFLCERFFEVTGIDPSSADYLSAHRWKYAQVTPSDNTPPVFDVSTGLGYTGDWCSQSRIEDAWSNAHILLSKLPST